MGRVFSRMQRETCTWDLIKTINGMGVEFIKLLPVKVIIFLI